MSQRKTTKRKLLAVAGAIGVEVEINPDTGFADAWAPRGKIFNASMCHVVSHHFNPGPWLTEVYGSMLEDLEAGLDDCTEPDCEVCHDEGVA